VPYHSKNYKDCADLNFNNCLQKLSADDWEMLLDSYEEYYRKGGFDRIFPFEDFGKNEYYSQFFEHPRYNNFVLWAAMRSKDNLLEKVCK
jgi:tubulin polyglutamylase TTLL4